MTVENRLYNLWYSVFILRIWRQWIKQSDSYTLKDNFITLNAYTCIEINAHSIISIIKKFSSDESLPKNMFTPWLMSSQPCEQLFRATRSITSTYSTVVNYSMLEILNRLNRIHYLEDVKTELQGQFTFPRTNTDTEQLSTTFQPMTDEDIEMTVLKAQQDAVSDAECMGVTYAYSSTLIVDLPEIKDLDCENKDLKEESEDCNLDDNIVQHYEDSSCNIQNFLDNHDKNRFGDSDSPSDSPSEDIEEYLEHYKGSLTLKYFTGKNQKTSESNNSRFLKVVLENGSIKTFKKSSLCWFFNENSKLSTDRLERFKTNRARKNKINVRGGILKSKQKTLRKRQPKSHIIKKRVKNAPSTSPSTSRRKSYSSETSSERDSNLFSYNDSTDISDINSEKEEECDTKKINVLNEHFYAVMYDKMWYIGKVVNQDQESLNIQMKFMKEDLEDFYWPKQDDLQLIEPIQIIYGPITMLGTHPMKLSRSDRLKILTLHKSLKKV
ncbi:unnamed protein product [Psylliodes chrysocephalus]|uniref:Uncharacterized protein n=1 Tax=Psylliodes chrysocephalus TaxID=3402493 RepID=A0A9P0GDD5_9CUCU|nr:unnamed protein product [Psylliodes chrysocephala]